VDEPLGFEVPVARGVVDVVPGLCSGEDAVDAEERDRTPVAGALLELPRHRERAGASEQHLRAALEQLRALAHGIFPRALAGEGLAAALEDIAEDARRIVRVNGLAPSAPETLEATAYLVVTTVASTPGGPVGVVTSGDARRLVVTVDGDSGSLPPALRDRVDALGGTLVQAPGRLRLELPCGS
jgi:hypothetical protein